MKKQYKHILATASLVFALAGTILMGSVNATPSQWFPGASTTIEYDLSTCMTRADGFHESWRFNVYNDTVDGFIQVISIYHDTNFEKNNGTWILLHENVTVSFHHVYSEKNATALQRQTVCSAGETNYTGDVMDIWQWSNSTQQTIKQFQTNEDTVDKNEFPTMVNSWIDYLNSSLGIGHEVISGRTIQAISGEFIIATWRFESGLGVTNETYVANRSGTILSYMFSASDNYGKANGFLSTGVSLTRVIPTENDGNGGGNSPSNISGYGAGIIAIACIAGSSIIAIKIKKPRGPRSV
ncbi:hypothetical protein GF325_13370 [Candidatus Bathyarchaeota archaeon]|nr:hypothetical protein [Candidatus Bathyarchaeota archaeon]